ncbi:MAG: M24 family metallopeptidase [Candidatus Hodarchaeales archaeon]
MQGTLVTFFNNIAFILKRIVVNSELAREDFSLTSKFERRIKRLQEHMKEQEWSSSFISRRINVYFLANTSQNGILHVPIDGDPCLLLRAGHERAKNETSFQVEKIRGYSDLRNLIPEPDRAGFENTVPAGVFWRFQKLFPATDFQDMSPVLRALRAIKTPDEITMIKEAGQLNDLGITTARNHLKPGITELELVAEIEYRMRKEGHQESILFDAFNSILAQHVLSGPNGALPGDGSTPLIGQGLSSSFPFGVSNRKIQQDEPVIIDIVSKYNGWLADQTRTYWHGKLSKEFQDGHLTCQEILEEVVAKTKIGTPVGELYNLATRMAREKGYENDFMGEASFLGHGLGLEIDELPVLVKGQTLPLQEGMVIAIEPKIVFKGKGAVGIENTLVMENGRLEKVTDATVQD